MLCSITKKLRFTKLTYIGLFLILQGCSTLGIYGDWPEDSEINTHLLWAKRFYKGSIIFPTGWHDMIDQLSSTLEDENDKSEAEQRLKTLGDKIVLEWLKPNNARLINSRHIATWGTALRTSAERNEQLIFITQVENDVDSLLAEQLSPESITNERYYPIEDYDNF